MDSASPGRRLRAAWAGPAFAVPGVFNALVAKMAERLGFRALYLSGGALSAASGVPDVGLLSLAEFVAEARTLTQATTLPLLCDADTGFGEALNVERTVPPVRGRRHRGHSPGGPTASEALWASLRQKFGAARRDGRQAARRGGRPA